MEKWGLLGSCVFQEDGKKQGGLEGCGNLVFYSDGAQIVPFRISLHIHQEDSYCALLWGPCRYCDSANQELVQAGLSKGQQNNEESFFPDSFTFTWVITSLGQAFFRILHLHRLSKAVHTFLQIHVCGGGLQAEFKLYMLKMLPLGLIQSVQKCQVSS